MNQTPNTSPLDVICHLARVLLARYAALYDGVLPRPGGTEPLSKDLAAWLRGEPLATAPSVRAFDADLVAWRERLANLQPNDATNPTSLTTQAEQTTRRYRALFVAYPGSEVERDLLALLVAHDLSPRIASVGRALSAWPEAAGLERTFLQLVLDPLGDNPDAVAELFRPQGRLAVSGLLRGLRDPDPARGVFVDLAPVVLSWLTLGPAIAAERVGGIRFYPRDSRDLLDVDACDLVDPAHSAALAGVMRGENPVRVRSAGGADVLVTTRLAARRLGLDVLAVELGSVPSDDGGRAALTLLEQALLIASLDGSVLLVRGLEREGAPENRLSPERLADLLRSMDEPPSHVGSPSDTVRSKSDTIRNSTSPAKSRTVLALEDPAPHDLPGTAAKLAGLLGAHTHDLAFPNTPERTRAWRILNPLARPEDCARLAAFPLAIEQICDLAARGLSGEPLAEGCRQAVGHRVGQLAQRVRTTTRWEDVVLPERVATVAREMVDFARNREEVLTRWGFGRRHSYGLGLAALFSGPPGTGKTMLAGLVAKELGLDLYKIDVSRIVSKYIGETEERLGRLFAEAARGGVALLFDEADSLFARRTEVKSSVDRYANLEVNFLLQKMEEFDGVAILTTNLSQSLDEALRRRIRFHARFEIPDLREREALWRAMLPPETPTHGELHLGALAQAYEFTGAEIKNASLRAAFLAVAANRHLDLALLDRAAQAECEERGRLVLKTAFDYL